MTTSLSWAQRLSVYLRLPLGIPGLYRKYDFTQATRIARGLLRQSAQGILGERATKFIRDLARLAWRLSGLTLIGWAIARGLEPLTYLHLWQSFALLVVGLSFSVSALGRVTLQPRAQLVFHPMRVLPIRLALLAILFVPVLLKMAWIPSVVFASLTLGAYFLLGPLIGQWLQLWSYQWGSPRKASIAEAMTLPMLDERSKLRFCAHEAGHGLMYGLGEAIPEDLYLYVDEELVGDGVGGAVLCAEEFTPEATNLENLRFRLMVLAAGAAGERVTLGNMSLAALQDFVSFEAIGSFYLLCSGQPVFAEPSTQEQHAVNAAALAKLRLEMIDLAEEVIRANGEVHDGLIQMLMTRRELAYDDVLPTLSKTRALPHAPRPQWGERTVVHPLIRT